MELIITPWGQRLCSAVWRYVLINDMDAFRICLCALAILQFLKIQRKLTSKKLQHLDDCNTVFINYSQMKTTFSLTCIDEFWKDVCSSFCIAFNISSALCHPPSSSARSVLYKWLWKLILYTKVFFTLL